MTASWSKGRSGRYPYYRCQKKGCPRFNKSIRGEDIEKDFAKLLTERKPKPQILDLTKAIVLDVWKREFGNVETRKRLREERVRELATKIEKCCDKIEQTNSETVSLRLERRVDEMEAERQRLQNNLAGGNVVSCDFETAVSVVFNFIKNPSKLWQSDNLQERRLVPKLVFAENLPYKKGAGYETARLSLLFELCREAEIDKSRVVEMLGKSLNHLEELILGWAEQIGNLPNAPSLACSNHATV